MDGFQANPEGLMSKGKRIIEIYEGYMSQKKNVDNTKNKVTSAWTGADSTGCVTAIESYDTDFKLLGSIIAQIGDILYRHGNRLAQSRDAIANAASNL